jgi:hypothetical protein
MYIITSINDKKFSLNGIQYLKNYLSATYNQKIEIFNCYERQDVLVEQTVYSEFSVNGITYNSAAALQAALLDVLYSRSNMGSASPEQDNIDIKKTFFFGLNDTNTQILASINSIPAYVVNEAQSVWFIGNITYVPSSGTPPLPYLPAIKYKMFNKGKGIYGAGGLQLTWADLELVFKDKFTANDVYNQATTQQIEMGDIGGQAIEGWLNTKVPSVNIQEQEDGYTLFKGVQNGSSVVYLWIGNGGTYGLPPRTLQAQSNNFQLLSENDQYSGTQNLQSVLNNGSTAEIDVPFRITQNLPGGLGGALSLEEGNFLLGNSGDTLITGGGTLTVSNGLGSIFNSKSTFNSDVLLNSYPSETNSAVSKAYVDVKVDSCIPLSGTPADNPVTGTLELEGDLKLSADSTIQTINGIISDNSTGLKIYNENDIIIQSNEAGSGLKGYHDYTANISDLDYVQKKYVDNVLDTVVSTARQDLPDDLFLSGIFKSGEDNGRYLMYKTNDYKVLDLHEMSGGSHSDIIYNVNNIERHKNDIFIEGSLGTDTIQLLDRYILALYDCKIINNILTPGAVKFKVYTGLIPDYNGGRTTVHAGEYHMGNLYYMTRPNGTSTTIATQLIKFNAYNLDDYIIMTLPSSAGYYNLVNTFQIYKDYIYILFTEKSTTTIPAGGGVSGITAGNLGVGYIVRVPTNFITSEVVFNIEQPGSETDKVELGNYFLIHNDEIIVPTSTTINAFYYRNTVGLSFYTLDGKLKRKKTGMQFSNILNNINRPAIHWMTIINNKLLLSKSSGGDTNNGLIRIDAGYGFNNDSILYEDFWPIQGATQWTNDASVTPDGYLLMNPEGTYGKLVKINYKDFADYELIDPMPDFLGTNGYYSLASINPKIQKESLKTKVSEFKNDGDGSSAFVTATQLALKQNQLIAGTNIAINNNADGTSTISSAGGGSGGAANLSYAPSPTGGTIYSDTGTDAALPLADISNAGLLSPGDKAKLDAITEYAAPYTLTPTWVGTTPPSGTMTATWQATKTGKHVNGRINIRNTVNGSAITGIILPLPVELPIPTNIPGFGASNDYMYPVTGFLSSGPTSGYGTAATRGALRKTAGNYEFVLTQASGTFGTVHLVFDYWTE